MAKNSFQVDKSVRLKPQTAAPSTPDDGTIYFDSVLNQYRGYKSGSFAELGSSGSSAGLTFFYDSLENGSTSNWATYKDAAGTTPVDGTGGSPTVITISASSSSPLNGTYSLAIAKSAANGQGEGTSAAFTVPSGYQVAGKRKIEFLWDGTDANYVAGDHTAYIYDVTNSALITPSITSLPAAKTLMSIAWNSSTASSYRLIFHCATTNASAYTVKADDITVSPGQVVLAAPIGPKTQWTPTYTGVGTVTNGTFSSWYQDGQYMVGNFYFTSGTVTASTFSILLPNGLHADTTNMTGRRFYAGTCRRIYTSVGPTNSAAVDTQALFIDTTASTFIYATYNSGSNDWRACNGNDILNNNDGLSGEFRIPIAEWAGTQTYVGTNAVEYAYNTSTTDANDTTSFGYGPGGARYGSFTASRSKSVQFQSTIQTTDKIELQATADGGVSWFAIGQRDQQPTAYHAQISNDYGMALEQATNNKTIIVFFGKYSGEAAAAAYGAAGGAWSGLASDANYSWRVVKYSSGQAVGFGLVTQTQSGLVSAAGQLLGTNTNNDAGAGYIGEYFQSTGTISPASANNDLYVNITSINLTAGDWDITGIVNFALGSTVSWIRSAMAISQFSGTTTTDHVVGDNQISTSAPTANNGTSAGAPNWRVKVANGATTTIYLKATTNIVTAGTGNCTGRISARRIR